MLGASAPLVSDSPPDAAAQRSAASDSPSSSNAGGSSSDDNEELEIVKIVGHRDTKGEPEDPNLNYCTVRFAELEAQGVGSEGEMELPESELLRRCPKLLREYRRGVGAAAGAAAAAAAMATSPAATAASSLDGWSSGSGASGGGAGARPRARAWSEEEVAQVKRLGRSQRGKQLGEAGFEELARRLHRSTSAVYSKWMKVQSPKQQRASRAGGAKRVRRSKKRRRKKLSEDVQEEDEVEEELGAPGAPWQSSNVALLQQGLWQSQLEVAALRSQVFTLRECLSLLGMRGIAQGGGAEARGS